MKLISEVEVNNGKITVVANPEFGDKYLHEDFTVSYIQKNDKPIDIDERYALVPFITNVAPIIWLSGVSVQVKEIDATFAKSLSRMKQVYKEMYPMYEWSGSITVEKTFRNNVTQNQDKAAVLFSGGVDSVYSSLYSGFENQALVTVRGADVPRDNNEAWNNVKTQAVEYANLFGLENIFIDSNLMKFINTAKLDRLWSKTSPWWTAVQHGPGFLSLLAPISAKFSDVFIASSHTEAFKKAWGSTLKLDEACKWGNVNTHHHGYDASRQVKVNRIVEKTQKNSNKPYLRVCYANPYGEGNNCVRCEKCLRTYAGLLVAGANPKEYGMNATPTTALKRIKRRFKQFTIPMGENEEFMWTDIQNGAKKAGVNTAVDKSGAEAFHSWITEFDFPAYHRRAKLPYKIRKTLVKLAKTTPGMERLVRKGVAALQSLRK